MEHKPSFYLYVLECADGTLYTGYTADVAARLGAHNAGKGAKYTRSRTPVRVVAQARFSSRGEAMSAEARFKRLSRPMKEALIMRSHAEGFAEVLAAYWREGDGGADKGQPRPKTAVHP